MGHVWRNIEGMPAPQLGDATPEERLITGNSRLTE